MIKGGDSGRRDDGAGDAGRELVCGIGGTFHRYEAICDHKICDL